LIKVLFANKSFITIVLSLFTQGNDDEDGCGGDNDNDENW
jgi:hypothetical protein